MARARQEGSSPEPVEGLARDSPRPFPLGRLVPSAVSCGLCEAGLPAAPAVPALLPAAYLCVPAAPPAVTAALGGPRWLGGPRSRPRGPRPDGRCCHIRGCGFPGVGQPRLVTGVGSGAVSRRDLGPLRTAGALQLPHRCKDGGPRPPEREETARGHCGGSGPTRGAPRSSSLAVPGRAAPAVARAQRPRGPGGRPHPAGPGSPGRGGAVGPRDRGAAAADGGRPERAVRAAETRGAAATPPLALEGPVQFHHGTCALTQGPWSPRDGAQLGACTRTGDVGDSGGRTPSTPTPPSGRTFCTM